MAEKLNQYGVRPGRGQRFSVNANFIIDNIKWNPIKLMNQAKNKGYRYDTKTKQWIKKYYTLDDVLNLKTYLISVTYEALIIEDGKIKDKVFRSVKADIQTTPGDLRREQVKLAKKDCRVRSTITLQYKYLQLVEDRIRSLELKRGQDIKDLLLRGVALPYKMMNPELCKIIQPNKEECVIDYLVHVCINSKRLRKYTRDQMKCEFPNWERGITVNQIADWCDKHKVSIYVLDPFDRVILRRIGTEDSISFKVNNQHLYPIVDPQWKQSIRAVAEDQTWNRSSAAITYDHERAVYIDTDNDGPDWFECIDSPEEESNCYINSSDLSDACRHYIEEYKVLPDVLIPSIGGQLTSMTINNRTFTASPMFQERIAICQMLFQMTELSCFEWKNQSTLQIAQSIMTNVLNITIPTSAYDEDIEMVGIYPYVEMSEGKKGSVGGVVIGYDWVKQFSSILLKQTDEWVNFSSFDIVENFDYNNDIICGYYYIDRHWRMNDFMIFDAGWYDYVEVRTALFNETITKADIKYQKVATNKCLSADFFKPLVEYVYSNLTEAQAKMVINVFIGGLAMKYNQSASCTIINDYDTVQSVYWSEIDNGRDCNITSITDDLHIMRSGERSIKPENHRMIWRQVIGKSHIMLDQMIKLLKPSRVLGINTDCVMILESETPQGGGVQRLLERGRSDNILTRIGGLRTERPKLRDHKRGALAKVDDTYDPIKETQRDWNEISKEVFLENPDAYPYMVVCEPGGVGKTKLLTDDIMIPCTKKAKVLSLTNKSLDVIRKYGEERVQTLTSFFENKYRDPCYPWQKEAREADFVILCLDEASMIPMRYMSKLIQMKAINPKIQFRFFMDNTQCLPVEGQKDKQIRYMDTYAFKKLCGFTRVVLPYIKGTCRYTEETHKFLKHFAKHHTIPKGFGSPVSCPPEVYVTATNKIKDETNQQITNGEWKIGDLLRCKINYKRLEVPIYNGQFATITDISETHVVIGTTTFPRTVLGEGFEHGFAQTVYAYQGSTIGTPYEIKELERMSFEEAMTSLGRTKDIRTVTFNDCDRIFKPMPTSRTPTVIHSIDCYSEEVGYIYGIYSNDELLYIGKTRDLERRYQEHLAGDMFTGIDIKIKSLVNLGNCSNHELNRAEKICIRKHIQKGFELMNTILYEDSPLIIPSEQTYTRYDKVSKMFNITDMGSYYRIKYDGFERLSRYGKRKTQQQAYDIMLAIRSNIIFEKYNIII